MPIFTSWNGVICPHIFFFFYLPRICAQLFPTPPFFFVHKKATLCSRPSEDCAQGHHVKVELIGSDEKQAAKISSAWPVATPDTHMRTYTHVYLFLFCLLLTVCIRRHVGATQGWRFPFSSFRALLILAVSALCRFVLQSVARCWFATKGR